MDQIDSDASTPRKGDSPIPDHYRAFPEILREPKPKIETGLPVTSALSNIREHPFENEASEVIEVHD